MTLKLQHKHSSVKDRLPQATDLEVGEIGLNINVDSVAAYIKDSASNIVPLSTPPVDANGTGAVETKGLMNFSYIPSLDDLA